MIPMNKDERYSMYEYSYLYATLSLGVFWLFFFLVRDDLRATMLILSVLFGIGGVLSEFVYINDWWNPVTMFGTAVGLEDFLFGFFFSGSVAVCYEILFNKAYAEQRHTPKWPFRFRYIALIICIVFFGSAFVLRLHSFIATILAFGLCISIILFYRKDLLASACFSSIFSGMLAFIFFGVPEFITAGWIESAWSLDNLSGHFIFYVPVEDFIWFMMAGAFIGPLYKFWKNRRSVALEERASTDQLIELNERYSCQQ